MTFGNLIKLGTMFSLVANVALASDPTGVYGQVTKAESGDSGHGITLKLTGRFRFALQPG